MMGLINPNIYLATEIGRLPLPLYKFIYQDPPRSVYLFVHIHATLVHVFVHVFSPMRHCMHDQVCVTSVHDSDGQFKIVPRQNIPPTHVSTQEDAIKGLFHTTLTHVSATLLLLPTHSVLTHSGLTEGISLLWPHSLTFHHVLPAGGE